MDNTSRGNSLQNVQHYAVTDNPVFRVKIRGLATNYEQPAISKEKQKVKDSETVDFKLGNLVVGKELNGKKTCRGKITYISNNKIIILDIESEEKVQLDPSTIRKIDTHSDDYATHKKRLNFTTESMITSFEDFIKSK